ncbi:glycosyltransferase family 4 protein [Fischerella sp. PCC 9605]|uniref:glycosyltransferase family 4 protein n=1 Tax=Fischerella sp. PCC 9605 TaxID=1173024 RepID=UPI0004B33BD6|nr:glycosyltransferase [Fischerella sp. PCC 9605]
MDIIIKENNPEQRKILISAYACRPNMGSEPGVGWNTVMELANYCQVWVLTREENRSAIEAELIKNPIPGISFVYCDPPRWAGWWKPTQLPHYYFWQLSAYLKARNLHSEIGFDLVHHVTYVRYSTPSFLSLLPVPFIWGPVGGGEFAPKAFWQDFSWRGKVYEILRSLAHRLGEIDPFTRLTARRSILVRATTEDTAKRLYQMRASNVEVCSAIAISQEEIERFAQCAKLENSPVRFISIARLLHWKGLHLGMQAFATADLPDDAEYWILGEGPEKKRLQALAKKLNIAQRVKFWGQLSRDETLSKLSECHVLLHPSLHDSGALVCLEAMAVGCPVICLDLGGPAVQVTEETGLKIPAQTPEQVVSSLADAISCLAKDSQLRSQMGQAGQKRVRENFSWEKKGQQLLKLYETILTQKSVQEFCTSHRH